MRLLNRDSSVVRRVRRCQSDLGYVSQETVNSDFSTSSSSWPRVGVHKRLTSGLYTANHTPRADTVVSPHSKLLAKVSNLLLDSDG